MLTAVFTKNWIGDVIFAEPLIRFLKEHFVAERLLCISPKRCEPVLAKNPYIDDCIFFDEKTTERSLAAKIKFIMRLRQQKIQRVYILHRSYSRALLCALAGIPERIGYNTKGRGGLLTEAFPFDEHQAHGSHDAEQFAALCGEALLPEEKRYRFYYSAADETAVAGLLRDAQVQKKQFIVLNPGANWEPKRWPTDSFAHFADLVHERYQLPCVITGNENDQMLADAIMGSVSHARCVSFCGKTTLTGLGALFSYSTCVVTADSGPMHIAAGVGAPVVALFGPTGFMRTGPFGTGKAVIVHKRVEGFSIPCFDESRARACMRNITPAMVLDAAAELMGI